MDQERKREIKPLESYKQFQFIAKDDENKLMPAKLDGRERTIGDFWQWAYSDLIQNITRGYVAEFIAAWALGLDGIPKKPWESFDLKSKQGSRIEVKSTGYLQSWKSKKKPEPKFVLEPKLAWSDEKGLAKKATWNAEIYILSYFFAGDPSIKTEFNFPPDPVNLSQWHFWVLRRDEVIRLMENRKSITTKALENERMPITAFDLPAAISRIDAKPSIIAKLSEQAFIELAEKGLDSRQLAGLKAILEFCKNSGKVVWNTKSFSAVFPGFRGKPSLFSIYSNGELQLAYGRLDGVPKAVFLKELGRIAEIKRILSDKKGYPMCKDRRWLYSTSDFIHAVEKLASL